jgi:hypothetical protein
MTVSTLPESAFDNLIRALEAMKPALPTVEDSYQMGRDYALNGPNNYNCRFQLFATPEHTHAWEKGNLDALTGQ